VEPLPLSCDPAIAAILAGVVERSPADVELLCGDFNDCEDGPVAALLEGRARFEAAEVAPWLDAVVGQVGRNAAPMTLDFAGNPRWKVRHSAIGCRK
jgi:hypothetical protein